MAFDCRPGCAACCIAPSISSPIPAPGTGGLARSKPAGELCPRLSADFRCELFGDPSRPAVCSSLKPCPEMCGSSREEALAILAELERRTAP